MAQRNPQTQAKRARELALRERRERKQAKKADAAARRAAAKIDPETGLVTYPDEATDEAADADTDTDSPDTGPDETA